MMCEGEMRPTRPGRPDHPPDCPPLLRLHQDETVAKLEKLQVCLSRGGKGRRRRRGLQVVGMCGVGCTEGGRRVGHEPHLIPHLCECRSKSGWSSTCSGTKRCGDNAGREGTGRGAIFPPPPSLPLVTLSTLTTSADRRVYSSPRPPSHLHSPQNPPLPLPLP